MEVYHRGFAALALTPCCKALGHGHHSVWSANAVIKRVSLEATEMVCKTLGYR